MKAATLVRAALFAGVFALALAARLMDPLGNPVIAAEDPYSHMVISKELAQNGYVAGPRTLDGPLYPPGLHVLFVTLWTSSGFDLYAFARFGPVVLGALCALGLAALVDRAAGTLPAAVAGVLAAVSPELISRTNLLFPTTLDLVLIPAFLLALVRSVDGERGALAYLALCGAAVMVSHPWALMLLAPISAGYAALRFAFPPAGEPRRIAGPAWTAGASAALGSIAYLWWKDAPFIGLEREFGAKIGTFLPTAAQRLGVAPGLLVAALAGTVLLVLLAALLAPRMLATPRRRLVAGVATGALLLIVALQVTTRLDHDLPEHVVYGNMLGAPAIVLAFAGLALVPARRTVAGDLGLVIVAVTYPFTAIDFFDSIYWSHRTVAYMIPGVVLLGGHAVGVLVRSIPARPARLAAGAAALSIVLVLATPLGFAGYSWYRYDTQEQFAVVEAARDAQAADPRAKVIAGAWQPNLFLRAIGDEQRVAWCPDCFEDPAVMQAKADELRAQGWRPYALVDHHTARASTLPGEVVASCCGGESALLRL